MSHFRNRKRTCDALYVSWKLDAGADSADSMQQVLAQGAERKLYRLCSWMVARGEARALIVPEAPLEEVADSLFSPVAAPVATRWIAGQLKCAAITREIETTPVAFGLASRPEQWPRSSAFQE